MEGPKKIDLVSEEIPERFLSEDPYVVLGVERGCSEDDVREARRRLLIMYHPDINRQISVDSANEITKRINISVDNLINKIRSNSGGVETDNKPDINREDINIDYKNLIIDCFKSKESFLDFVSMMKQGGISEEDIYNILNEPSIIKIIKYWFIVHALLNGFSSINFDDFKEFFKNLGIDFTNFSDLQRRSRDIELLILASYENNKKNCDDLIKYLIKHNFIFSPLFILKLVKKIKDM